MKFDGKIHEEIVSKNESEINYIMLNLTLLHDGYHPEIFKTKIRLKEILKYSKR